MNLDNAKRTILSYMNQDLRFVYKGPRNQIEEFIGRIVKCYPSIFLIQTLEDTVKAFSYNDFIIKNIKIYTCE